MRGGVSILFSELLLNYTGNRSASWLGPLDVHTSVCGARCCVREAQRASPINRGMKKETEAMPGSA